MVGGACVLVLVLGGVAGELGVGVATLLIGLVVAALVAFDEIRRDDDRAGACGDGAVKAPGRGAPGGDPGACDPDT